MWYEMTWTKKWDEKMGRDVQVRDGFGAINPGTRMVPCWLVCRLYKPKSETKPIQYVASKTKNHFGPKSPVSRVRNVPLPRTLASTICTRYLTIFCHYKV